MTGRWKKVMSKIDIYPSKVEDAKSIYIISALSFPSPWSLESIEKELSSNDAANYVTAKIDDQVIGYGGFWIVLDEAHITNIAVHPEYRGIGAGNKIMDALIEVCKIHHVHEMTLEVRKSNLRAQNLYEKYGFIEEGIRKKYYADNQEDAVIMWKHSV